ncbi:MAG TPA: hypothetical protein VG294_08340 [Solirubrobacteraceae bacterium]|jgi:hypothetical protein|nr:hypothetical protein [Solirubrobacteraceae bacterium]
MADPRRFEPDEFLIRPGTYFNPQTEVLVVVDDSPELDAEMFHLEDFDGPEWVLISDEVPVDEHQRDELLEAFQIRQQPGARTSADEDEDEDEPEELEPDEDPGHE